MAHGARGKADQWGPPGEAKPAYSVVYTGRLFGYFRYPDVQRTSDVGCPSETETPLPAAAEQYRRTLRQMQSQRGSSQVLVSMGDNFAPELLARSMQTAAQPARLVRKDLFAVRDEGKKWQTNLSSSETVTDKGLEPGTVPSDNVGCFLRLMGFNAVVPGEHDFYYGPERLRQLARFLAEPQTGNYLPVQMLAANLSITTKPHTPAPPLPAGTLSAKKRDALSPTDALEIQLPSNVMPWLQDVTVTSEASDLRVFDCLASRDDPNRFTLPDDAKSDCVRLENTSGHSYPFAKPPRPSSNFIAGYYALDPGDNHALCVEYREHGQQQTHCQLFSVHYPFFQYRPHTDGTTPAPYFLSQKNADGKGVAIFGVIDPNLASYVGQLNGVWMNKNRRYDSEITITDPLEALRQVLSLCASDEHCRGRRKILLAQMPYFKATALTTKISGFDVVISQPDSEHANGDEHRSQTVENGDAESDRAFLLTPGTPFDTKRDGFLSTNLRQADLYVSQENGRSLQEFLANQVGNRPVTPAENDGNCRSCTLNAAVANVTSEANAPPEKTYETLALMAMERFCQSDIALLQHRDVFGGFGRAVAFWPRDVDYSAQNLLDEALWKGDFTFCLPLKGSTLKKMLADSAAFDKQDSDNLSPQVEKGRGLSTLGIVIDPGSKVPLIRGEPVEDNKLYGVAMTDYLAFGNTGYAEISSEALPPLIRVTALKDLNRLTGLACEELPQKVTDGSCQTEEIQASQYFEALRQRPFDTSRGLTAWVQLREWATHPLQPQQASTTLLGEHTSSPEQEVESRGMWWFALQNVSLDYDLSFIGGSDKTVPGNFAGINTFSQLSTAESSRIGFWTRARGGYSFPKYVDFFASGETKYARTAIRNSASNGNFGAYQLTLNSNLVRGQVGVLTKPLSRKAPIRGLLSENVFTQATEPFQQFNVPGVAGGPSQIATFNLGKNFLVMSRIGARLQNNQSWFEAGREYGVNIGIPVSYTLQDPGNVPPFSCALTGNRSLSRCVASDPAFTAQSAILPDLRNQRVAGWFADFHTVAPLYRDRLQLAVDSYGEVFDNRRDDTGFNTRYYEDFTLSLNVPLWGSLTFAPRWRRSTTRTR